MAALTVQTITIDGLEAVYSAASGGGDTMAVDSSQDHFLDVVNGGGAPINVTIAKKSGLTSIMVPGVGSLAIADKVIAVTNGERRHIGPFSDAYIQADGTVSIAYSGVTSVTVAALKLAKTSPN